MKLLSFFLLAAVLQVSATGWAQTVTYKGTDQPLETVMAVIREQTGYAVFYKTEHLRRAKPVTVELNNVPLSEALNTIFEKQPLTFQIEGNTIVIGEKKIPPAAPPVTGIVRGPDGRPLAGVTVAVKGTAKGTSTDANGKFELIAEPNEVVVISSIGYETKEIRINSSAELAVTLRIASNDLDEVQIQAYGTTSRRLNTGNISTVKADDIEKAPIQNVLSALQGRLAGVDITQATGLPGAPFKIRVRGTNSIRLDGNEPLYVIDGVPYTSQMIQGVYGPGIGAGNPLNFLDPSQIESVDILKDADATSIYGSRAANGVVLITTKKGNAGETRFSTDIRQGGGQITRKLDLLNTAQYLEMRREAFANDNESQYLDNPDFDIFYPDLKIWSQTAYTDWQKLLIGHTAQFTDAQAALSGGSELTQFRLAGGFNRQTTVFPGDWADKRGSLSLHLNNSSAKRKLKIAFQANFISDNNFLPASDPMNNILLPPNAPAVHLPDATLNWEPFGNNLSTWNNPLAALLQTYRSRTSNLIANNTLTYTLFRQFDVKLAAGYNLSQQSQLLSNPIPSFNPTQFISTGNSVFSNNKIASWNLEPQLTYGFNIRSVTVNALVGTTIQDYTAAGWVVNATGYKNDAFLGDINSAPTLTPNGSTNNRYKYNSAFTRLNLNYLDRYILNLTGRRDGSNKFGPGNRFGNFGAVGAAWLFSNEKTIRKALPFLSFGKLRVSYGTTGNDQIPYYRYINSYSSVGVSGNTLPYQGVVGIGPNNLFNPGYVWEINKKFESGLELGLFKDRLFITGSYFQNRSGNQLVDYRLPSFTGFTSVTENLGAVVENAGWEITASSKNFVGNDFAWSTQGNITIARNKLVHFPDLETSAYANDYILGEAITINRAYKFAGVNPENGVYTFFDKDQKPVEDPGFGTENRLVVINRSPKFYGGISNSFTYKGFTIDVLFQFVKQLGQNYLFGGTNTDPGFPSNQPVTVLSRRQKPGDQTSIGRFNQNYALFLSNEYARNSDLAYVDASYIRLKNLSINYSFPSKWITAIHANALRLFLQGQNMFTITKYKGPDPENQSLTALPPLKLLTAGIHVEF